MCHLKLYGRIHLLEQISEPLFKSKWVNNNTALTCLSTRWFLQKERSWLDNEQIQRVLEEGKNIHVKCFQCFQSLKVIEPQQTTLQTFQWCLLHWRKQQTQTPANIFLLTSDSFVSMETNLQAGPIKKYLVNFSMRTSHCGLKSGSQWILIIHRPT